MNQFRLSKHPSSYYRALFEQGIVEVRPALAAGYYQFGNGTMVKVQDRSPNSMHLSAKPEQGFVKIDADDLEFEIYLEAANSAVFPEVLQLAKDVLLQIVEMDEIARSRPMDFDYEEHLAYVNITRSEIELHYFASTVNTEWGAYFVRDANGTFQFDCLG